MRVALKLIDLLLQIAISKGSDSCENKSIYSGYKSKVVVLNKEGLLLVKNVWVYNIETEEDKQLIKKQRR